MLLCHFILRQTSHVCSGHVFVAAYDIDTHVIFPKSLNARAWLAERFAHVADVPS